MDQEYAQLIVRALTGIDSTLERIAGALEELSEAASCVAGENSPAYRYRNLRPVTTLVPVDYEEDE